jgi:hypothetical protein
MNKNYTSIMAFSVIFEVGPYCGIRGHYFPHRLNAQKTKYIRDDDKDYISFNTTIGSSVFFCEGTDERGE